MRYILTKIGLFVLTLWAAVTLNFILPRLMPGLPVDAALAKLASNGVPVTNAERNAIEAQLGSPHGSVWSQYWNYLVNLAHLRFGRSFTDPTRTVGGSILRGGDFILALTGAANRDPKYFANPDELDITRTGRPHLSLGVAPHVCLGGPLARLEARTAFRVLAVRLPNLRLATDKPRWKPWQPTKTELGLSFGLRALKELPLIW